MTPRRDRGGYTLVEVLMAMAIFMVLVVPLAWIGVMSAQGKARARRIDDAVALSREDWGLVRRTPHHAIRDTTYLRTLGGASFRVRREVDTAASPADSLLSGLAGPARSRTWTEVRTCVVALAAAAGSDSSRCYSWRVPATRIQP